MRRMTTNVDVRMNMCGKVHSITISMTLDGDFIFTVDTDCDHVKEFIESLSPLTLEDLTDKQNSRIFKRMQEAKMSATCLFPSGLLSAGWLEAGLWARSRAKDVGDNRIEFIL
jgi:hypothetical protein